MEGRDELFSSLYYSLKGGGGAIPKAGSYTAAQDALDNASVEG